MEEDVLNALQTRTAYLPGSFDRDGRIIFIVNVLNDLYSWQQQSLKLSIAYLKRSLSDAILQKGVTVVVDAQKTTVRINRHHARLIYSLFEGLTVNLYLVKSEGFWEKHVETCTKSQVKGEPIVLSRSRLVKYFDVSSLPEELGGQLQFNYDLWLQQRKSVDEFVKFYDNCLCTMESFQKLLQSNKSIRITEVNTALKKNSQRHATVQCSIETVIEMGNRILTRFNEVYSPIPPHNKNRNSFNATGAKTNATTTKAAAAATIVTTIINDHEMRTPVATANGLMKCLLPPDLTCERSRIEMRLNEIERRQTDLRTAWLELIQTVRETRELATLEEGVAFVTNWILNTAEQMLNRQTAIGCDVKACESLRSAHDSLELECRETYGFYAEILYKIETYMGSKETPAFRDLLSQKEFMQFVCRSFATRLERRRNILITSLRFYRLVTEYFEQTTQVFESLVMGGSGASGKIQDFTKASGTLKKLKSSQQCLSSIERELIKEGEKLSDMLSMPVKDALGRDLHIDYSEDICSVREILDTTLARRKIFSDSVELQKLTLEQVTHIYTYEQDACMAIKWLDDLYNVMIKCHSHVGCNIHEIQVQKDELQTFQETGKSIFNYGCQLLEASQTLRSTCKLEITEALRMQQQLEKTWHSLQAISQEHMTRLRVSAVFHRSVEDYCQQLIELRRSLRTMLQQQQTQLRLQQRSSSSGISSESESQAQSPATSGGGIEARRISHSLPQHTHTMIISDVGNGHHNDIADDDDDDDDEDAGSEKSINEQRELLRKYLMEREKLLVEVGRMVRLGRLLKTRLKEPFVLDAATGKSIVVEDLPSEITTPSPTVESTISGSSSNTSTLESHSINEVLDPSKIVINPINNNGLACNAITNKLSDIAEVAESLDAVIRDVQENVQLVEVESNANPSHKKLGTLQSTSSEDWHSRSTEDDSFVTASEGNFTPSSSSFQTASGRTSSFISCDKNSYDASEADDSNFAYEMPEFTSPLNMSFEGSEQSYLSAQPPNNMMAKDVQKIPATLGYAGNSLAEDQTTTADIEELHSESVTPTPEQHYDGYHMESIPVESETELEVAAIADVLPKEILTEHVTMAMSRTPEVSATNSNINSNQNTITTQITVNLSRDSNEQPEQQNSSSSSTNNNNNNKPNAAWRRSKYYENITKQTIKGFL